MRGSRCALHLTATFCSASCVNAAALLPHSAWGAEAASNETRAAACCAGTSRLRQVEMVAVQIDTRLWMTNHRNGHASQVQQTSPVIVVEPTRDQLRR